MSKPRTYRTEALVLHQLRTGEADRILTLYTPGLGKTRAVARGVLRPTSHLAGHLEPFSRSTLLIARARNLDIVTQAETAESFPQVRGDLARAASAMCGFELLDRLTEDAADSHQIYALLLAFLRWLEQGDPDIPLRYFELRLLAISGFGPELYQCLACARRLDPEVNGFSAEAGGVLCPECAKANAGARPISVNALKVMRLFQAGDAEQSRRVRVEDGLARELEGLMRYYLPVITERELKAVAFVDNVRATRS